MGDSLLGLRHDGVVGRDDDDGQVGHLGAAGTHGGKGLVTRGIQEGDPATVGQFYVVGTDVLGDTTRLAGNHVGIADVVQEGGLTMVHMAHDGDDRRPAHEVFLTVRFLLLNLVGQLRGHEFHLVTEFLGHQDQGFGIEPLVDGYHHTQAHAGADYLDDRGIVHQGGQVVDRHEFRYFQNLLFGQFFGQFLLGAVGGGFAFLLAVLGAEVALLVVVHPGVGLLDLLLDFLLHGFLLLLGHGRFEAVTVAFATLAFLAFLLGGNVLGTGFLPVFLAGLVVGFDLVHIHLLASLGDALAFFGFLFVELGKVDLAQDLESGCVFFLCRRGRGGGFLLGSGNLRFGFGHGFGLGHGFRFRLCDGLGFRFRYRFRFGLGDRLGFGRCHRFRFRLNDGFRFGFRNRFRFRFRFRYRFGFGLGNGLRFRLCDGFGCGREGVGLDDGFADRFELVLFLLVLAFAGLFEDVRDAHVHLLGGLLGLQVLSELLVKCRFVLIRNLGVRIGLHFHTFALQEVHQRLETDVVFLDKFVESDFSHI